ncbi:Os02g0623300 [Oryza sativa Japonica Group]|uniref:Os02g0623300 protein n=1 Tax=Oryza sativa subsp. japonica TaxID=39947 RepID=Q6K1Q2_ORYSJ|nr:unknown protein [Oryza sativa Japonica Group]BAF09384.1 Os02g0623300 [Oryza sativa Japonica Group]|eukprot:NP_001047470.1 Os02g0623300 [Oryza sativa Japonica Group]
MRLPFMCFAGGLGAMQGVSEEEGRRRRPAGQRRRRLSHLHRLDVDDDVVTATAAGPPPPCSRSGGRLLRRFPAAGCWLRLRRRLREPHAAGGATLPIRRRGYRVPGGVRRRRRGSRRVRVWDILGLGLRARRHGECSWRHQVVPAGLELIDPGTKQIYFAYVRTYVYASYTGSDR